MAGLHFWSVGYCVSTVGMDEATIRRYVREQDERDRRLDGDQQEFDFNNK